MIETKLITQYPHEIIAVDEVGRGPLGGPVVVGAVRPFVEEKEGLKTLLRFLRQGGIKDSKKTAGQERSKLLQKLGIELLPYREKGIVTYKGIEVSYVTWEMEASVIDLENILAASLRAMK